MDEHICGDGWPDWGDGEDCPNCPLTSILAEGRNDPPWLRYDERGSGVTSRRPT